MQMFNLDLWFYVVYFTGVGLSLLSTIIVLLILYKIEFKDHSTSLRAFLAVIDLISSIILLIPYIPTDDVNYSCYYNSLYYFVMLLRSFWVCFIAYSLFMVICKNNETINSYNLCAFGTFVILSLLGTWFVLVLKANSEDCYVFNTKDTMVIYLFVIAVGVEIIIFALISYWYLRIRASILNEMNKCDLISRNRRHCCVRLIGYPLLFLILIAFNALDVSQTMLGKKGLTLFYIRIFIVAFYPFMNSLLYGLTRSSKKYIYTLFVKSPEYHEQQETLNFYRSEGYFSDRVFLDIADISESEVFTCNKQQENPYPNS